MSKIGFVLVLIGHTLFVSLTSCNMCSVYVAMQYGFAILTHTALFYDFKWTRCIYNIITDICRLDIWLNQHFIRPLYLKHLTKRILISQYCLNGQTLCHNQIKVTFTNLLDQPLFWRITLKNIFKLRTANHKTTDRNREVVPNTVRRKNL